LDDCIKLCRSTLSDTVAELPQVLWASFILTDSLRERPSLENLTEATNICRSAIARCPQDDRLHPVLLNTLGHCYRLRFGLLNDSSDLHQALMLHEEALQYGSDEDTEYPVTLLKLGTTLQIRFTCNGSRDDLERAIELQREALRLLPLGSPERAGYQTNLAFTLQERYSLLGLAEDLYEAIALQRCCLSESHPEHTRRGVFLLNLARSLLSHFDASGDAKDLEDAAKLLREALPISENSPSYHGMAATLAGILHELYSQYGDIQYLEEAIALCRQNLTESNSLNQFLPGILSNLAIALNSRYCHLGDESDIEEAVVICKQSMDLYSLDHTRRHISVKNLAEQYLTRFGFTRSLEDLEKAIDLIRQVVSLRVPGHPLRMTALETLSSALQQYPASNSTARFIDEAIALGKEGIDCCGVTNPIRQRLLRTLASVYKQKWDINKDVSDIRIARELLDDALILLPLGHSERAQCILDIADMDLQLKKYEGLMSLLQGMDDAHCSAFIRLDKAIRILSTLRAKFFDQSMATHRLIADAYVRAIGLLPRVAYFGLDVKSRLRSLRIADSLPLDAAFYMLTFGSIQSAVELLEQGRGFFWKQSLRYWTETDSLPEDMKQQLAELSWQLEKDSHQFIRTSSGDVNKVDVERRVARTRSQSERLDRLLHDIRQLPAHRRFMTPDDYSTLRMAAANGPVIMLLPGKDSCNAIVMRQDEALTSLVLPNVTDEWLSEKGEAWTRSMSATESTNRRLAIRKVNKTRAQSEEHLRLLSDLWINVVKPVIVVLGLTVGVIRMTAGHFLKFTCSPPLVVRALAYGGVQ
jgi:tetratricopeptide (TPR) repeat protein